MNQVILGKLIIFREENKKRKGLDEWNDEESSPHAQYTKDIERIYSDGFNLCLDVLMPAISSIEASEHDSRCEMVKNLRNECNCHKSVLKEIDKSLDERRIDWKAYGQSVKELKGLIAE